MKPEERRTALIVFLTGVFIAAIVASRRQAGDETPLTKAEHDQLNWEGVQRAAGLVDRNPNNTRGALARRMWGLAYRFLKRSREAPP